MENEERTEDRDRQAGDQVQTSEQQEHPKVNSEAGFERALRRLKNVIWILAVFIALLCAFSVLNMTIAGKALVGVQRDLASIGEIRESLKEIQKTTARLKKMIEELSQPEEEGSEGEQGQIWDGKI